MLINFHPQGAGSMVVGPLTKHLASGVLHTSGCRILGVYDNVC